MLLLFLSMMILIIGLLVLRPSTSNLLQSATSVITKCDNFITKNRYYKVRQFYYKERQVLQSVTIITKCERTHQQKRFLKPSFITHLELKGRTSSCYTPVASLENHALFQTKMAKVCIRFQSKTAQKPYPLQRFHYELQQQENSVK